MALVTKYKLDLDAAWARTLQRAQRAEVPDIIRLEDLSLVWEDQRAALIESLDNDTYSPKQAAVVEVPKDDFAVRPFAVLHQMDHVVYEAVVARLAPYIESALSDETLFSSRVSITEPGSYRLKNQHKAWLSFQDAAVELHKEHTEALMLTTDVASYFEYIDIGILIKELKSLPGVPKDVVQLLSNLLNPIERTSDIWGIPQGPVASGILGNFYLLAVDRALDHLPVTLLRYQDDMKVFGDDESTLRIALRDIIRVMRNRHLNIAVRKTKILEGDEILEEIEDKRKDAIQYGLEQGDPAAPEAVRQLFDDAVSADKIDGRDIRFAVYRLQKNEDPHAIPWILDNLARAPFLAHLLVEYLSSHFSARPEIESKVCDYLRSGANIYPYVEMQLMRMFSRAETISDDTLVIVKQIASDGNRENYVREHAIRCIGRHAKPGDVGALKAQFNNSTDFRMRRALLVAIVEAAGVDKGWLGEIAKNDSSLVSTASYLRKGATMPIP